MNLLDTGVNHQHTGQPRQTHPPVATVDANALWLKLGPFGEWNRFKRVDIQRFPTLPTPNLSQPTASLGGLLCGLCGSQMPRFPTYPIWLKTWLAMWMCHAGKTKAKLPTSTHTFVKEKWQSHLEHLPGLGEWKTIRGTSHTCHIPDNIDPAELKQSENTERRNTQELPKPPEHFGDLIRLILDLAAAVNFQQNVHCECYFFYSNLCIETLLVILQYRRKRIPSSHFRRNANFRGRAVNMGSISPDSTGAKRSRLKVGPQFGFRVCDSLLLLAWQVSFRSASHQRAACKQK